MRLRILFAVVALLLAGAPVLAEAPHPPAGDKAAGTPGGGGHGKSENKFAFAALERYDLGIYTLIVFGLLMIILGKYAWPNIAAGLKKREASIIGAREEAAKAKADAEELRAKLQKDYADAQDKIRAMIEDARRDAESLRITEREAGARDAQEARERARREIQAEKDAVLQELYQQAVQLASLLASKTIRRQLSPDDHKRLLDESLAEIRTNIKA
jgi:F-type H+-transporting ATPase subunit b